VGTSVIVIILGSAVLHAAWNAIIKGGTDKLLETSLKALGGAALMLCCMPFLPLPAPASWPFLAGTAGIHLFYYLFMAHAYQSSDMSYAYTLMHGSGVRLAGEPLAYICWVSFLNCFPITIFAFCRRGAKAYLGYLKTRWKCGITGGVCSAVAYGLVVWCMNRAPISQVAALRETSVVFGMLLSVIFLKEKMTPSRVTAVFTVLIGAVVMRLYS
jgi:drug/metabolite transporter (DMT)-like permease